MEISINNEIKQIIENANNQLKKNNNKYYRDVLDFLNMLFDDKAKQILKLQFKKITLNDNIFIFYNSIIDKYKLNKPIFDYEKFDISEINDTDSILNIAFTMCKNLLEKINYKIFKYNDNYGKKKLKIKLID